MAEGSDKLPWLLNNRLPLIGGWLRRRAVHRLCRKNTPDGVAVLAEAAVGCADQEVRESAIAGICGLVDQESIDKVCCAWARSRDVRLEQIVVENGYIARRPLKARVLSALLQQKPELIVSLPSEVVTPLISALEDAHTGIRSAARLAITELTNSESRQLVGNQLCQRWAETRSPQLLHIMQRGRYVASQPLEVRVLSALKTGQSSLLFEEGPEVVDVLLRATTEDDDDIAKRASITLSEVTHPESRKIASDQVCQRWANTRSPLLLEIMQRGRYVASEPLEVRVLSALKTGQSPLLYKQGPEVVDVLLRAVTEIDDDIAENASTTLRQLTVRVTQEAVCDRALEQDNPHAKGAAVEAGYAPRDEHRRALFFFITEQWNRYEDLDFDHRLLRAVYDSADKDLRKQIADKLRASGRTDYLAVLTGSDLQVRSSKMTPAEADFFVNMLVSNREWQRLWKLVFDFPFATSVRIVQLLGANGWSPDRPDERAALDQLLPLADNNILVTTQEIQRHTPPAVQRASAQIGGRVADVSFSPHRPHIAIGTNRQQLVLWNYQQGCREHVFKGFQRVIKVVTYTRDDTLLCAEGAQVGREGVLHGWLDGQRFSEGHPGMITALAPAGRSGVLITRRDNQAILWDSKTWRPSAHCRLPIWPRAARVSTDGSQALLLHDGMTLLQLPDMRVQAESNGKLHGGVSRGAAFAPEKNAQVVGNWNGDVFVARRKGGHLNAERDSMHRCSGQVQGVEVLAQRKAVIVADSSGQVTFFHWPNRAKIGSVAVTGRLLSLHVSPGEEFLALGDDDSMTFWDLRVMQIPLLFSAPFAESKPYHLAAIQALVESNHLPPRVREAMAFVEKVLRHRFRYDIEIDEVRSIRPGEYDIDID